MASDNHQLSSKQGFPSSSGEDFPFFNALSTQGPGVVHIWYNIPLCTIFAQQSNGDIFRTKLSDPKIMPPIHHHLRRMTFQLFSLAIPWNLPEDHSRTPTTWPCRSWVFNSHQDYSKGSSQRLHNISISCQGAKYFNTPWTTQSVHTGSNQSTCMYLAQLGQFIFHCGSSVTQFNSQDGQNCIGPIKTIQLGDSPSRISLSAFHIYWPTFITWGLFPQLTNILDLFFSLCSFTLLK
ncbi:hypothetical protein O181_012103 [Austropuccinia psidii MF-1]|uniref:Uncharacterized protein n=1 Tax=Austropuccinia psidii MF-1 TaxID=1389203 RepID=A0A9Q3GLW8_9BASI|nr:hypothetical protein [Austropuccinia psidii MF-1]